MPAQLLYRKREVFQGENAFYEIVIWIVDPSVRGSNHEYKYRLAYVVNDICVMRYDNEAGKGDHKHIGDNEYPTSFADIHDLLEQFHNDMIMLRR